MSLDTANDRGEPWSQDLDAGGHALEALVRLARVVKYRRRTVLWTLAACLSVGAAYYATAQRYYRSTAKLLVVDQSTGDLVTMNDQAGSDNLMATHKELVKSSEVLTRAIERLAPEFRIDFVDEKPNQWVRTISERLSASTVRKTNFINVGYDSLDPEAAAAVVRAVIEAYVDFVGETHRGTAAEVLEVLTVERDQLEESLAMKQLELQQSRERVGHLSLPDREDVVDPIISRAIQFNDALLEAQRRRLDLQSSLTTIELAIQRGEDLSRHMGLVEESIGEAAMLSAMGMGPNDMEVLAAQQAKLINQRDELRRLTPFYGPSHPQVATLRSQIEATEQYLASYRSDASGRPTGLTSAEIGPLLVGMLNQALSQANERVKQLEEAFQVARSEASRQSGDLVKVDMLGREVQRLEKLHDLLFEKIANVDIHQVQAPIRATIVEEPLPSDHPATPQLRMVLMASLMAGLSLGIGLVYAQDLLDDRFGSPEEMAMQLGCRVLAVIRELPTRAGVGLEKVQMFSQPQATESESFRTLRTAITLGAEVSERLVISSSEPGDGKTTVSANLAVSYAQTGKRTLIIDCDMRKPGLTALLELKGQAGVTDILTAKGDVGAAAERCVLRTALDTLDVIPAGARRPDPAELLLGPNFAELLAWADSKYDQVLVDCPPILAVSDALIAAHLVDGVVLVVTPEKNHRRLVSRACGLFTSGGAPLLGVVVNRVSGQIGKGYGYGYGYGYSYGDEIEEQETPDERRPPLAA